MKDVPSVAAIVPMRHSSERVPGKNYRDFAGRPLFYHIVSTLLAVPEITEVVVDTDSDTIIEMCEKDFPKVTVLRRPKSLQDGSIPMNDVLLNVTRQVEADFYFQTHSTNPLLQSETTSKGLQIFLDQQPIYDSLFSVTARYTRYWDPLARPINHNQNILLRTQDLPTVFEENSCMYVFTQEILESKHNRIGDRPFLYEMPEIESQDIDIELNFLVAEFLYQQLNKVDQ